jgi:AraC family transcriptional regulator, regulatory protein of adaptative response / methylated-DNA-[protein]-cysteine methyltransferase
MLTFVLKINDREKMDHSNYYLVEDTIRYLVRNYRNQPSLDEIAGEMHISSFHLQRTFTEWAGISPKKFLQYLTVEALKSELIHTENVMQAADNVGLSAQSRVYDLFVSLEAVTPGEFKTRGRGMLIEYGMHPTPFGDCFIAVTSRGICALSFTDKESGNALQELQGQWEWADFSENSLHTGKLAGQIFNPKTTGQSFSLLVKGSPFQVRVWEALLKIPFGGVISYHGLACSAGFPKAFRAVGTAVAHNPVAFLIPCHRVIRNEGIIGNYRWDPCRKSAMIGWEKAVSITNFQSPINP